MVQKELEKDGMERFARLSRLLQQYHQQVQMSMGPFGDPRRGQGRILAILHMKPEITQKELSFLLDMRPQSMGELLAKLEKKELITRQPSERDRRVMEIRLTEKGREAVTKKHAEAKAGAFNILEVLDEEEQQQLAALMDKLITAMEAKVESGIGFGGHGPFDGGRGGRFGPEAGFGGAAMGFGGQRQDHHQDHCHGIDHHHEGGSQNHHRRYGNRTGFVQNHHHGDEDGRDHCSGQDHHCGCDLEEDGDDC